MQAKKIRLKDYTTMRVGGSAQLIEPKTIIELKETLTELKTASTPFYILGSGSNTIASNDYKGVIVKPRLTLLKVSEDGRVEAGANENWDSIVRATSDFGLSGIEALASIPGTAGAAPVQNIGAYGQELADVISSVTVIDTNDIERGEYELDKNDCDFSYRNSMFKKNPGRYVITKITMQLKPTNNEAANYLQPPFYKSLQAHFNKNNITDFSPKSITSAVTKVRKTRLPDPKVVANSGSFFKNPIIDEQNFAHLQADFPDVPSWSMPNDTVKISAGWLLEQAGLKGLKNDFFGTYENNALVIINHNNGNYTELKQFRDQLNQNIKQKFNIELEQEPIELT
jgi:UDP-N-acetylmuramate dehydrogenase